MNKLILVVDDEKSLLNGITALLEEEGYAYRVASDGDEALRVYREQRPDLVILDIMMPKKNGFQVCSEIRAVDTDTPIIMLTAKGDIVDKSIGFKAGADDYVTKPFMGEELLLRIEALLRRSEVKGSTSSRGSRAIARIGDLEIQFKRQRVLLREETVEVTPKEFQILALMANRPGEVFTAREIIEHVWGDDYAGEITSVAVFIRRIREKIEEDPSKPHFLNTVWRVGYCLGEPRSERLQS